VVGGFDMLQHSTVEHMEWRSGWYTQRGFIDDGNEKS
jgi:hypothetical protein